jgi:hypothetical protein
MFIGGNLPAKRARSIRFRLSDRNQYFQMRNAVHKTQANGKTTPRIRNVEKFLTVSQPGQFTCLLFDRLNSVAGF